ncbi:hypothetical protein GCM10022243_16730 [Saccharothrix violaceirubra]|uniref:Acetyl esterase n=1 Tax=Saccharothrix violaceirubra TaxID=413306 RepID=A0A7W7WXY1_9PSEU|nr:alpha/beta hydrolase [Saccharothrix violaceirubra]MBB4967637.1 acetyl esterase [Saccharothrix violaceirubra]
MPLNDQARAVLDKLSGAAPVTTPAAARSAAGGYLAFQGAPADVSVEHLFVPGPTADLPARVYRPRLDGPLPGIVFLHGSGWTICNLDHYDVILRALAEATGHVVFAVNYQKAPEHPFPVPLDDCEAAATWFVRNAVRFGVEPDRIGVFGDSAGGNLAAALTLRRTVPFAFQVLVYPALDRDFGTQSAVDFAEGYGLDADTMRWFWDQYVGATTPVEATPGRGDLTGLPPAFVATAEYDPVRDDGERYAAGLAAAGVPVRLRRFPGTIHAFLLMDGVLDEARTLLAEVSAWLGER